MQMQGNKLKLIFHCSFCSSRQKANVIVSYWFLLENMMLARLYQTI